MSRLKLITEDNFEDIKVDHVINESTGTKSWYIQGVFAQAEKPNRNRRIYPSSLLEREINRYNTNHVVKGSALGELNHPEYIEPNPRMATHRITEIIKQGNDYIGKAIVLNTPEGKVVQGLLEGGTILGVSTRGAGTLKESKVKGILEVNNDYMMSTIDIVLNPSGIDCFVNGIYEKAEWIWEGDKLIQVAAEKAKSIVEQEKDLVQAFRVYMESLKA